MNIEHTLHDFLVKNFYLPAADGIGSEASLLESGIVDSTGLLEVIAFIEGSFGIRVEDAEILPENLDSIARLTSFVQRKQRAGAGAERVS
jgi:acyl carrier protein